MFIDGGRPNDIFAEGKVGTKLLSRLADCLCSNENIFASVTESVGKMR